MTKVMNDIETVVKRADITDWKTRVFDQKYFNDFLQRFLGSKIDFIRNDKVRELFLQTFVRIEKDAQGDAQKKAAFLIMVNMYDQMIKGVIMYELQRLLTGLSDEQLRPKVQALDDINAGIREASRKFEKLKNDIETMKVEFEQANKSRPLQEFVHSLLYVADNFTETEKERDTIKEVADRVFIKTKSKKS
jgi:hypothetical protein